MLLYETAADGTLSVAGVQAPEATLVIPAMQDGKPVRRILKNSLRELTGVRSIRIADSVTEIGDFACYASPDLIRVSLSETLTELGDGVFRGCEALQSVHYAAPQGNFYALRALLTEPEPACRIAIGRLRYPYRLSEARREEYRAYLAAESETAAELAFRDYEASRDRARLVATMTWLRREQLLSGEARRFALEEAGKAKLAELSAELLQGREQRQSTDFSL